MGRLLAIDYGTKRCGIAVSDEARLIAGGLPTVRTHDLIDFIATYVAQENVERVIIGLPYQMSGELSNIVDKIMAFARRLRGQLPMLPLAFYDERYTTVLAHRAMQEAGLKKKDRQRKELADEVSAVILLQSYMESRIYRHG